MRTFGKLLLLFTLVPFIELYLLLKLAELTSASVTFAVIISTGILGAYLSKQQGNRVLGRIKREVELGRLPGDDMIHGTCVLVGGILLLTPGILTDVVGFTLLLPGIRHIYVKIIKTKLALFLQGGQVHLYHHESVKRDPFDDAF